MALFVGLEEGLAVSRAAAVVDGQDNVAVVYKILQQIGIATSALAAGTAMDPDESGRFSFGGGLLGFVENGGDLHTVEGFVADDLAINQVCRIDGGVLRVGQLLNRLTLQVKQKQVGRRVVAVEVEAHEIFVARERDVGDLAFGKGGESERLASGIVKDFHSRTRIFVHADDAVFAVAREVDEQNIPLLALNRFGLASRNFVTRRVSELAAFIGEVVKIAGIRREGLRIEADLARMRCEVLHLLCFKAVEIDVGIVIGFGFRKCDVLFVVGNAGEVVAGVVLIEELWFEVGDFGAVEVEEALIAGVRKEEEGGFVKGPAAKEGFRFVAGSEVGLVAVEVLYIEVGAFVPTVIAGEQDAIVFREIGNGVGGVFGGGGERRRFAAGDGDVKGVVDAGLIAGNEDGFLVGGKGAAEDVGGGEELLDGVLLGHAGLEGGGDSQESKQTDGWALHFVSMSFFSGQRDGGDGELCPGAAIFAV